MILLIVLTATVVGYLYVKWKYSYWTKKGLYQPKPELLFGNTKAMFLGKKSVADTFKHFYDSFKSKGLKHGGIYQFVQPVYIALDPEIIKCILQRDFNHFRNHPDYVNEKADPLLGHLVALMDEKWKNLRVKLTPTFTTGKMKMMFPTMVACTDGLKDILKEYAKVNDAVDIKEVMSLFTTDIIGSAAFGLDFNTLKNPDSEFRQFGRKVFETSFNLKLRKIIAKILPHNFLKLINFKQMDKEIENFFMGVVKSTIDYREKNNIYRKDFLHLLLQLKNKGKITDDGDITPVKNEKDGNFLSFNEVAAQCFVFFVAGFETSSTLITFALLELAQYPDIQKKLRNEIKTVLNKYNNQITYEAIMEMTYLDKVVNETLRKHSPAPATSRMCNNTYTIPNTDVTIEKGVNVIIPILGLHRDPEFYPEPEVFDPERFNEENKAKRHQFTFLPFGEGPRMCIGARFGLLQTKVGLTTIIKDFNVNINHKTKLPISYATKTPILCVDGDVWLNLQTLE